MSKIGEKKKRIAGKKNRWEKSKIGSGLTTVLTSYITIMVVSYKKVTWK